MDRKHFKCLLWKGLWGLAVAAGALACVSAISGRVLFLYTAEHWFWNALILAVLAIPIKLDCTSCGVCMTTKE